MFSTKKNFSNELVPGGPLWIVFTVFFNFRSSFVFDLQRLFDFIATFEKCCILFVFKLIQNIKAVRVRCSTMSQ